MTNIKRKHIKTFRIIFPVLIILMSWYQLEVSSGYCGILQCFQMNIKYIILNILTVGVIFASLIIITNNVWISSLLLSSFSFLVSIINHYTIKLHGMPFTIMEIKNFNTALNVLHAYKLEIDYYSICIFILFIICLTLCFVVCKNAEEKNSLEFRKILLRDLGMLILSVCIIYFGYFSEKPIKPLNTIEWSWTEAYHTYGYMACSLEMIYQTRHVVEMPEGYSTDKLKNIDIRKEQVVKNQRPDIILILNESFYDLKQITDIKTDVPYMENINSMENTITGYTVVTSPGGGTNSSEYELLTSNSLQLMKGITPFNVMNMKGANSIVSHLKQLGYETTGAHSEAAMNYSRGRAYPDMGFDNVYFDDEFKDKVYYGNRWFETDESLYKNLISWYEQGQTSASPQFIYLLTIQNHGGWDMNPNEDDIVHVLNNYDGLEQQLNEYLTSIRQSDIAFKNITDYFTTVDRPVVVCMVGDHSPIFASDIVDVKYSPEEKKKLLRSTPFIIWTNYESSSQDLGYISLNYLLPVLLENAQIATSPYYDYLIKLRKEVPILTSYDIYWDSDGEIHSYKDNTEHTNAVNSYFYLEYNNLQTDRIQSFFDAY